MARKYKGKEYELVDQPKKNMECAGCVFYGDDEGCKVVNDGDCLLDGAMKIWKEKQ